MQTRAIYNGDNFQILKGVDPESVDLIYIDPPFNSGMLYENIFGDKEEKRHFDDRFGDIDKYHAWIEPRLAALYRVLKPSGSIYVHCDPHANYRIRAILQDRLGLHFRSEIVWKRTTAHSDTKQGRKQHGRIHDTILFFTKSNEWTWNPQYMEYKPEYTSKMYRHVEDGTGRRYGLFDITAPGGANPIKRNPHYELLGIKRYWRFKEEKALKMVADGRIVQSKPGAVPRQKRYLDEMPGVPLQDVWDDIKPLGAQAGERVKYPTQKPLSLLRRIIECSSDEDDVVLDAFCGCGTTLIAAAALRREWIGIDVSPTACRVMANRLRDEMGQLEGVHFVVRAAEFDEVVLKKMSPLEFEHWAVNALGGIPNIKKGADHGIDGRIVAVNSSLSEKMQKKLAFHSYVGKQAGLFEDVVPIQVKQKDKAGRPDLDAFQTAMRRLKTKFGVFVAFGYSSEAERERDRAEREEGLVIRLMTVRELLGARRAA